MPFNAQIYYYGKLTNAKGVDIQTALEKTKQYGIALVKASTPVKSGTLKAGWDAQVTHNGIIWKNPTPYSGYVELGTKRMRGRNMLGNSLPYIKEYFGKQVAKSLGARVASQVVRSVPITYGTIRKL